LQFEYGFLWDKYGIEFKGGMFDTLLAARVLSNESPMKVYPKTYLDIVSKYRDELLDPPDDLMDAWEEAEEAAAKGRKKLVAFKGDRERVSNSLDMVLLRFLEIQPGPDMSTSDWKREQLTDRQLVYAVEDTKHLFKLRDAILADADDGDKRIIQLDLDTQAVCLSLYKEGLPVNRKRLEEALIKRTAALEEAHRVAAAVLPGTDFESPADCVKALGALGIYVESIEKTELAQYADNPVISPLIRVRALIAEVRDLETKFTAHLRSDDRLHGVYNPGGATSGRLSAKSPNLQNVRRPPSKVDLASDPDITNFRDLVEAPEGWQIIVADYNQMELRAAAVFTEEPTMLKVYKEGRGDLHKETAARLSDSDFEQMTDEEKGEARQKAKAANFGLVYGQQAKGFRNYAANSYGVDLDYEGAVEMRNKFFNLYPGLAVWHELAMEYSWTFPEYEETLYGRKRWLHPWSEECRQNWAAFQNLTNHIIQGSCADAFKLALVGIHKALDPHEARLIGNVHDEILALARDHAVEDPKKIIRNAMQTGASIVFGNAISFTAELKSGKSWACK
jgi:DNA polymerase I-like protein with 3'-5' exonuclease and polymerase domains